MIAVTWHLLTSITITTGAGTATGAPPISLARLLREMVDGASLARWPEPEYQSRQASSYNRASVSPDQPGWFDDQDGVSCLRTETDAQGHTTSVLMEHEGPGCITRIWTPFFYHSLDDHTGPSVSIWLDGTGEPLLTCALIDLVTGRGPIAPPFAQLTARAGDCFLPIPFARSCKITLDGKPFYHVIEYRVYAPGTAITTLTVQQLWESTDLFSSVAAAWSGAEHEPNHEQDFHIAPGASESFELTGPAAIEQLQIETHGASPQDLRSLVLSIRCDGEQTVWCPVGALFGAADRVHAFAMRCLAVASTGMMTSRWVMPFERTAQVALANLGASTITARVRGATRAWSWDDRSLHFHASWQWLPPEPAKPVHDLNFITIEGRGLLVGDLLTVLNPKDGWWGEGDEKIYVDADHARRFPSHFGTGTEDYYGWAGGVLPTRADEFSHPQLANIRVGGDPVNARGYNVCARSRCLDAIPFRERLTFDLEASTGLEDWYTAQDTMQYSTVVFWYARPGATHNRPPQPDAARQPLARLPDVKPAR